ncbi:hypothetical protein [Catellatospora tritici]|uniref:hypothetical protein n=1 Tax=Catellatospora tritici TaxID=2851566 RepID=UPI001C2DA25C|nr:hypothetical protein [Catellatospora tritici]MBV1849572.1 hypothetical protein [Catellatospora tritici]
MTELPAALAHFATDIAKLVEPLPPTVSCVATGSLVEGLGNADSDVDLYMISDDQAPGQSSSFGLRQSGYVDCEYFKQAAIQHLGERVNGCTWADIETERVSLKDVDRYYRIAISHRIVVTAATEQTLHAFTKQAAARALSMLGTFRAFEHAARAAYLHAVGRRCEADLLAREGSAWYATARLAEDGEGYASLKWVGEKAARRYGRDSARFDQLISPSVRPSGDLGARVALLGTTATAPPELATLIESRSCGLAAGVHVLHAGDDSFLLNAGRSIAQIDNATAAVLRAVEAGGTWRAATDTVAATLELSGTQLRTALWAELQPARAQGLLV